MYHIFLIYDYRRLDLKAFLTTKSVYSFSLFQSTSIRMFPLNSLFIDFLSVVITENIVLFSGNRCFIRIVIPEDELNCSMWKCFIKLKNLLN